MAKNKLIQEKSTGLGTSAVFFTAISTILGAVMFLRFGYAVGNVGFINSIWIIIIGHLVTIPTAMAIAEIATNQKVEGGGEYYIISRSFGLNIGGAIGIALFLSQAISVAFYIIAFAQAFEPLFGVILEKTNYYIYDKRIITIPFTLFLVLLIYKKGAGIGLKMLYIVVVVLGISLVLFFLGSNPEYTSTLTKFPLNEGNKDSNFFFWFAICFPGFTGMTAGVGLSGDLKNPSRGIPIGTMLATVFGMLIYIAIVYKLALCASPEELRTDQLIMGKIALGGAFVIPIGLAAATFSSAIGSIIVAPRTLQALGQDNILPSQKANDFVSKNQEGTTEPINSTLITAVIAFGIVLINDVDKVAGIISIFFMITYGAICIISFFEHFAADPSYRPVFRSRWYLSLLGAVLCIGLMFLMNPVYSIIGILFMVIIFIMVTKGQDGKQGMTVIFQGVISQLSRRLQVFLQKVEKEQTEEHWRPSIICISSDSFDRYAAFEVLKWFSAKYGFGTYIHLIEGYLSKETYDLANKSLERLIANADKTKSNVYLDTLISPSFTSAIAQTIQLPGISGKENNMILFEFPKESINSETKLNQIVENFPIIKSTHFDICVLASSIKNFGFKKNIHIWITSSDYDNANLMILMAYIVLGHNQWKKGNIKIFALYPENELKNQKEKLMSLINSGRLPISSNNIELISKQEDHSEKSIINEHSEDADLTIIGFRRELVKHNSVDVFNGYEKLGDILFVNTNQQKNIK